MPMYAGQTPVPPSQLTFLFVSDCGGERSEAGGPRTGAAQQPARTRPSPARARPSRALAAGEAPRTWNADNRAEPVRICARRAHPPCATAAPGSGVQSESTAEAAGRQALRERERVISDLCAAAVP